MSRAVPRFRRVNPSLPPAQPNVFQVSVIGSIEAQMTVTTFYYWDNNALLNGASETNVALGFHTALSGPYRGCCSSDWTWQATKIQCLTTLTRAPFTSSANAGLAGTGPAGHEPTEVAAIIQRRTLFKGQSGRGRIMMPAVPLTFVTNSALNAAGVTGFNPLVSNLGATFTQATTVYQPVLVSRRGKNPVVLGAANVTSVNLVTLLGTVRRRRIGRGK